MRDTLARERVEPLLRGAFGHPYVYHDTCLSTQGLLAGDLPEGAVAVCDVQTVGRGRLGRRWRAPAGRALLLSVLLRPPRGRRIPELSLVAGLAVAVALERATEQPIGVKWPNDVVLRERKVAGVLAEVSGEAVVLGVGINVNQRENELPAGGKVPAGSLLAADGMVRDRALLLVELLAELERAYASWRDERLSALLPGLRDRDVLRGREVRVAGRAGTAVGIDGRGRLEVDHGGERAAVESGEVELA